MVQTDRLCLPLLAAGQAQKEMTHNEALTLMDLAIAMAVEAADLAEPPASPGLGQCWIVATGGAGDWAERDGQIAGWTQAGWRFLAPCAGMRAWQSALGHMVRFDGESWLSESARADGYYVEEQRVVGARAGAIPDASGGSIVDVEARFSLNLTLAALREHGLIE